MATEVSRVAVWTGKIKDRSGGLSEKIEAVSEAGANLEFVIARRSPERPGTGFVFLAPLRGVAQCRAARAAGLRKASNVYTIRVEGPNRPGLGAKITRTVADLGINMLGLSGTGLGRRCAIYISVDTSADADKARRALKKAFSGK